VVSEVSDVSDVSEPTTSTGAGTGAGAGAGTSTGSGTGTEGDASARGADIVRPRVVLIGPPGSGKTSVGRALASLLGVDPHDTDHAIEVRQGRSISDIFMEEGEPRFRELERSEVASSLASHGGVLSLGGGAVMDSGTAQALTGHLVVFLDVGIADAAIRVGFNASRPLLAVNPRAQWTRMMDLRRPTYQRLATFTVLTTGRTPQDVAAEIARRLERIEPETSLEHIAPETSLEHIAPETDGTGERRE